MHVARFAPDGRHLWSRSLAAGARPNAIASDTLGGAIIVGSFSGDVDFGLGVTVAEGIDGFVLWLDAAGESMRVEVHGGPDEQRIERIAVSAARTIVAGTFRGSVSVGAAGEVSALPSTGFISAYVADISEGGEPWAEALSSAGNDSIGGIAIADDGRVAITGAINGPATFGSAVLPHVSGEDVVLLMLDPSHGLSWAHSYGGQGSDAGRGVAFDGRGGVVMAGFFTMGIDFGGGSMASHGCEDLFVAAFDADGHHLRSARFGDGAPQVPKAIAIAPDGALLVAGDFLGGIDFGWGALDSAGALDTYVVRFDADGAPQWAQRYGGAARDAVSAMALAPDGTIVVAGSYEATMDVGPDTLAAHGATDVFVAALRP
jgi:hypothetical protein